MAIRDVILTANCFNFSFIWTNVNHADPCYQLSTKVYILLPLTVLSLANLKNLKLQENVQLGIEPG